MATAADDPIVGKQTGSESSLSNWAGDYVTDMLGKGKLLQTNHTKLIPAHFRLGNLQPNKQRFKGVGNLSVPTEQMGAAGFQPQKFTAQAAQDYMNPYLQAALDPQIEEARRQAQITRLGDANRLTQAGAYGGSRQAIMESELNRSLGQNLANITGQGYQTAYDKAMQQFNTEQSAAQQAQNLTNQYGLQALQNQANLGAQERAIQAEGIAADIAQFEEERDFPYKQTQYQQSLLQGLPLAAQSYSYAKPSQLSELLGGSGGLMGLLQSFGIIPSDAE